MASFEHREDRRGMKEYVLSGVKVIHINKRVEVVTTADQKYYNLNKIDKLGKFKVIESPPGLLAICFHDGVPASLLATQIGRNCSWFQNYELGISGLEMMLELEWGAYAVVPV
jgi:hypothetical protein